MSDHEATYAMMALRASVADRTAPAEFTAAMARQVVEYVDWQRFRIATAREALHRLSHYHSSPLQDVAQTTKQVRQIAADTLAAMDGEEG